MHHDRRSVALASAREADRRGPVRRGRGRARGDWCAARGGAGPAAGRTLRRSPRATGRGARPSCGARSTSGSRWEPSRAPRWPRRSWRRQRDPREHAARLPSCRRAGPTTTSRSGPTSCAPGAMSASATSRPRSRPSPRGASSCAGAASSSTRPFRPTPGRPTRSWRAAAASPSPRRGPCTRRPSAWAPRSASTSTSPAPGGEHVRRPQGAPHGARRGPPGRGHGPAARGLLRRGRADRRPGALARIAGGAGLDPAAVGAMLAGDEYAADVRGDEREAAALGITAVPFFVIDRRLGLAGAHPAETIREAIQQARLGVGSCTSSGTPRCRSTAVSPGPATTCRSSRPSPATARSATSTTSSRASTRS